MARCRRSGGGRVALAMACLALLALTHVSAQDGRGPQYRLQASSAASEGSGEPGRHETRRRRLITSMRAPPPPPPPPAGRWQLEPSTARPAAPAAGAAVPPVPLLSQLADPHSGRLPTLRFAGQPEWSRPLPHPSSSAIPSVHDLPLEPTDFSPYLAAPPGQQPPPPPPPPHALDYMHLALAAASAPPAAVGQTVSTRPEAADTGPPGGTESTQQAPNPGLQGSNAAPDGKTESIGTTERPTAERAPPGVDKDGPQPTPDAVKERTHVISDRKRHQLHASAGKTDRSDEAQAENEEDLEPPDAYYYQDIYQDEYEDYYYDYPEAPTEGGAIVHQHESGPRDAAVTDKLARPGPASELPTVVTTSSTQSYQQSATQDPRPNTTSQEPTTIDLQTTNAPTSSHNTDLHTTRATTSTHNTDLHTIRASTSTHNTDLHTTRASTSVHNTDLHTTRASTSTHNTDLHTTRASTSSHKDFHVTRASTSTSNREPQKQGAPSQTEPPQGNVKTTTAKIPLFLFPNFPQFGAESTQSSRAVKLPAAQPQKPVSAKPTSKPIQQPTADGTGQEQYEATTTVAPTADPGTVRISRKPIPSLHTRPSFSQHYRFGKDAHNAITEAPTKRQQPSVKATPPASQPVPGRPAPLSLAQIRAAIQPFSLAEMLVESGQSLSQFLRARPSMSDVMAIVERLKARREGRPAPTADAGPEPTAEVRTVTEDVRTAADDVRTATENVQAATEDVRTTTEDVQVATDDVQVATDDVRTATENVQAATEDVRTTTEDVQVATDDVQVATDDVRTATEDVRTATEDVQAATEDVQAVTDDDQAVTEDVPTANEDARAATEDTPETTEVDRKKPPMPQPEPADVAAILRAMKERPPSPPRPPPAASGPSVRFPWQSAERRLPAGLQAPGRSVQPRPQPATGRPPPPPSPPVSSSPARRRSWSLAEILAEKDISLPEFLAQGGDVKQLLLQYNGLKGDEESQDEVTATPHGQTPSTDSVAGTNTSGGRKQMAPATDQSNQITPGGADRKQVYSLAEILKIKGLTLKEFVSSGGSVREILAEYNGADWRRQRPTPAAPTATTAAAPRQHEEQVTSPPAESSSRRPGLVLPTRPGRPPASLRPLFGEGGSYGAPGGRLGLRLDGADPPVYGRPLVRTRVGGGGPPAPRRPAVRYQPAPDDGQPYRYEGERFDEPASSLPPDALFERVNQETEPVWPEPASADAAAEPAPAADDTAVRDAVITGGVVGGCALCFFVGLMIFCKWRQRREAKVLRPGPAVGSDGSSSPLDTADIDLTNYAKAYKRKSAGFWGSLRKSFNQRYAAAYSESPYGGVGGST